MKDSKTKNIVMTSVFAAIIAVFTAYIHINTGINSGYIHFGDAVIYLAACILPPPYAVCAASIGGMLADTLSGVPVWIVPTGIIKALNVIPFVLLRKDKGIINTGTIVASVISGIITMVGYFIAEGIIFSFATASVGMIFRLVQPVGSAIVFIAVGKALDKAAFRERILKI